MKLSLLATLLLLGICGALAGCSESENKPPTPEDLKNFKGGTPPPEVQKKLQDAAANASKGAKVIP